MFRLAIVSLILCACSVVCQAQSTGPLPLQAPAVSRTQIGFVYAGSVWIVDRQGGEARRLTAQPGSAEVASLEAALVEAEISILPQTSSVRAEVQARLWEAAGTGNLADAKVALEAGADLNALDTRTNQNGRTALNYAAEENQAAMIQWLVERGAEVNRANNTGFTPLHHAAESGSPAAVEMLLKLGADLKATTRRGETPLAVAKRRGMTEVAAMLEKAGGK